MYDHVPQEDFGVRWPILSDPFRAVVTGKVREDDRAWISLGDCKDLEHNREARVGGRVKRHVRICTKQRVRVL